MFTQRARLFGWIEGKHLDVNDGAEAEEKGDKDEGQAIKGYLKFAGQGQDCCHSSHFPLTRLEPCTDLRSSVACVPFSRAAQGEPLQGTEGQVDLHLELLQGHLWFVLRSDFFSCRTAPTYQDMFICVSGLMRHMSEGSAAQGADNFIPLLIYVVLKSNPPHLISNIE